jgi:hypothetical protein
MPTVRLGRFECEDDRLPRVCMRCGEPSTVVKCRNFSWLPPWVGFLLLAAVLPYILAAVVATKRCSVYAPLCDRHAYHWLWRTLFIWLTLLGFLMLIGVVIGIAIAADSAGTGPDWLVGVAVLASAGLFLVGLAAIAVVKQGAIRPIEITDRSITLTRVADGFIAAIEDMEDKRSRDRWDDEDDDRPSRARVRGEESDRHRTGR